MINVNDRGEGASAHDVIIFCYSVKTRNRERYQFKQFQVFMKVKEYSVLYFNNYLVLALLPALHAGRLSYM